MAIEITCECGKRLTVNDEFAGQRQQCPNCREWLTLPMKPNPKTEQPSVADRKSRMAEAIDASTVLAEFQRDKFLLHERIVTSSKTHHVEDEAGGPLLVVQCTSRIGRFAAAVFAGTIAGAITMALAMAVLFFVMFEWLHVEKDREQVTILVFALGSPIVMTVVGVIVFLFVLGKQHFKFYAEDAQDRTLLELRPSSRFGLTTDYDVIDDQGNCVAQLITNHIYNALRERWLAYHPDGSLWAVAKERSLVPRLLRRVLRSAFGLLFMLALLLLLCVACASLAAANIPALYLVAVVIGIVAMAANSVLRKSHTNCVFLKRDEQTVLGELDRRDLVQDRNVLDLSADAEHHLDRRVALAVGILLDSR